jgi:predicted PurR-regulated permease PerM
MTCWLPIRLTSPRVAAVVLVGLTFWVIRSFIVPLIWAAIFSIANWQLYRRSAQHLSVALRALVLPLVFSLLIALLALGPVIFAFGILAVQSQALLTEISFMDKAGFAAPSWLGAIPVPVLDRVAQDTHPLDLHFEDRQRFFDTARRFLARKLTTATSTEP